MQILFSILQKLKKTAFILFSFGCVTTNAAAFSLKPLKTAEMQYKSSYYFFADVDLADLSEYAVTIDEYGSDIWHYINTHSDFIDLQNYFYIAYDDSYGFFQDPIKTQNMKPFRVKVTHQPGVGYAFEAVPIIDYDGYLMHHFIDYGFNVADLNQVEKLFFFIGESKLKLCDEMQAFQCKELPLKETSLVVGSQSYMRIYFNEGPDDSVHE